MPDKICEICTKKPPTEQGFWDLCAECHQLYIAFLGWVRRNPDLTMDDIQKIKGLISEELRKGNKVENFTTLMRDVQIPVNI